MSRTKATLSGAVMTCVGLAVAACGPQRPANAKAPAPEARAPAPEPNRPQATAADKALAARYDKALADAMDTPARELANGLKAGWQKALVGVLKGEKRGNLARARKVIGENAAVLERGNRWPARRPCRAPRADQAPTIDGRLDDPAWKRAATFTGVYPFNHTRKLDEPNTIWKVTWDADYLYFGFRCADVDVNAPTMPRDDHVYFHDCVEMFLLPEPRTRAYWEIVVSPAGMVFDGLHAKKHTEFGCVPGAFEDLAGLKVGTRIDGTNRRHDDTDVGYCVEVAVPFKELPEYSRAEPAAGQTLSFIMVRLDKNTTKDGKDEFKTYAHQPLMTWGHNVWSHAELKLIE
jgi:hypothetical protein